MSKTATTTKSQAGRQGQERSRSQQANGIDRNAPA